MAAAWVQKIDRWDGFPSSQFGQINSPKMKTLETSFSYANFPSNFLIEEGIQKGAFRGNTGANRRQGPTGPVGPGRPAHPVPVAGPIRFPVYHPFFTFLAHGKSWPSKSSRETPEK
jgi:hypothetical protein